MEIKLFSHFPSTRVHLEQPKKRAEESESQSKKEDQEAYDLDLVVTQRASSHPIKGTSGDTCGGTYGASCGGSCTCSDTCTCQGTFGCP